MNSIRTSSPTPPTLSGPSPIPTQTQNSTPIKPSFLPNRTLKSDIIHENNKIFDDEQLNQKVTEYLNMKIQNEKVPNEAVNPQHPQNQHEEFCVCTDCIYARMLNKPSHTMFNLTMKSIYKKSYPKSSMSMSGGQATEMRKLQEDSHNFELANKSAVMGSYKDEPQEGLKNISDGNNQTKNLSHSFKLQQLKVPFDKFSGKVINEAGEPLLPPQKVTIDSMYQTQTKFPSNSCEYESSTTEPTINNQSQKQVLKKLYPITKRQSLKGQDQIKSPKEAPFQNITTYSNKFPGVSGQSPHIKPIDKNYRGEFPLDSKTMNKTFYRGQSDKKTPSAKSPDMLKTGRLPMLVKESSTKRDLSPPQNPEKYNHQWMRASDKNWTTNYSSYTKEKEKSSSPLGIIFLSILTNRLVNLSEFLHRWRGFGNIQVQEEAHQGYSDKAWKGTMKGVYQNNNSRIKQSIEKEPSSSIVCIPDIPV